ncbi:hypothetical protein SAY86_010798 [Trapa natans]|uniref:glucan endo-1,3-beta-D-glucosidase n=1 Tax=Trapa natans TaxID=22666 RepID=A0AAN7R3M1_TRANT|nr:hypothetical protein SAY86_010798 [Trapa natans]
MGWRQTGLEDWARIGGGDWWRAVGDETDSRGASENHSLFITGKSVHRLTTEANLSPLLFDSDTIEGLLDRYVVKKEQSLDDEEAELQARQQLTSTRREALSLYRDILWATQSALEKHAEKQQLQITWTSEAVGKGDRQECLRKSVKWKTDRQCCGRDKCVTGHLQEDEGDEKMALSVTEMEFPSSSYFLPLLLLSILAFAESNSIGVNYGRIADNLPAPQKVVELLKQSGITRIKLYDTDATVLSALANSNISVTVAMPNELLSSAAADQSFTDTWVQANIFKYFPATKIEAIAVGNEVFVDPRNTTGFLVPAMKNVHSSLVKLKLDYNISISSPIALTALQSSYPTSSGSFNSTLTGPVIVPMLDFLRKTGSYLMVNAYPFFAYSGNADKISIDYALFKENPGVVDSGNGLKYNSLFEAQVDAVYAALSALKYDDIRVVVTETGWPSKGDENEVGAGPENAAAYNGNLVRRVLTGNGTPLRPNFTLDVFMFALFNENQKPGPTSERNYGLFYPNEQRVYDIPLTMKDLGSGKQLVTASPEASTGGEVSTSAVAQTWCVANGNAPKEKLQAALDFACGEGGADCKPIHEGAACFSPNSLEAHASYAFNSYYQKKARAAGSCYFSGVAYLVTQPPKYGTCVFPTGY